MDLRGAKSFIPVAGENRNPLPRIALKKISDQNQPETKQRNKSEQIADALDVFTG